MAGDEDHLIEPVYRELRVIASNWLRNERSDVQISTHELIHEAYLRLAAAGLTFRDETHYRWLAVRSMRRVLVDMARSRTRSKRGGGWMRISLSEIEGIDARDPRAFLDLNDAMDTLAEEHAQAAQVVVMRFFGGYSQKEIAETLGVTDRTVRNHYAFAKARLRTLLDPPPPD